MVILGFHEALGLRGGVGKGLSEEGLLFLQLLPKVRGGTWRWLIGSVGRRQDLRDVTALDIASRASLVLLPTPQSLHPMVLPLHLLPADLGPSHSAASHTAW